jgi:putative phage-type endonuclease
MTEQPADLDERRAFLERRQHGIGASDAAAVLGLSPWGTPLSVYHSKVDPIPDDVSPGSLPMWLGLRLEDIVAELFTARTGLATRGDNRHHTHPEDPWLVAHLDFRVLGQPDQLVECKTQSSRTGWGDDGTDDIPVYYWIQCQHEMLVTGAKLTHVPVLFGLYDFKVYVVQRDEAFLETWRVAAAEFWHEHVEARVPPPLGGDDFSKKVVRARWPEYDEALKVLPPERELLILRLREEKEKLKEQATAVAALEHRVEDLIGDSAGVEGSWGKITWKRIKDRVVTEWQLVAEMYEAAMQDALDYVSPDDDIGTKAMASLQAAKETARSLYTRIEPGYRRIDIRFKKEDK